MTLARPRAPILTAALATVAVVAAGGLATDIGPWYQNLRLPDWKPPDAAFGPIWTLLFVGCAVVAVRCWDAAANRAGRRKVVALFALNGTLNVLWTVLFFTLHRPDWAQWEVLPLWLSVLWLILALRHFDRLVVPLLLPYLVWVGVAAAMNRQIVLENAPWPRVPVVSPAVARSGVVNLPSLQGRPRSFALRTKYSVSPKQLDGTPRCCS